MFFFFFSSRRRHTRYWRDWSSDVCSSDLHRADPDPGDPGGARRHPDRRRGPRHGATGGHRGQRRRGRRLLPGGTRRHPRPAGPGNPDPRGTCAPARREERLRIARELHDILGHAMATISVQAGVGLHVIEQRPGQAREALAAIKKICDDGLTDIKTILGILRTDTTPTDEPRAPRGGLDRLPDLLHTAEAAGLQVELTVAGEPRPLPAPVDLAAYRIIQEALTNVLRHAPTHTVRLALTHEPVRLLIRIRNNPTTSGPTTSGPT